LKLELDSVFSFKEFGKGFPALLISVRTVMLLEGAVLLCHAGLGETFCTSSDNYRRQAKTTALLELIATQKEQSHLIQLHFPKI